MISTHQKQQITQALHDYMQTHKVSANKVSERSDINESYISSIYNGKESVAKSPIKDKWYILLADFLRIKLQKEYWAIRETPQMYRMLSTLEDAKENGVTNIIIGETGCGKSFISNLFIKANPIDTFKIVVGSLDTIGDLLDKVIDVLKIATPKTKSKKISEIAKRLKQLQLEGQKPHLIFDECEYMKQPALCSMKELYDALFGICGITLIGTSQLLDNLEKLRRKNRAGIPQFYRRVKFGIRELPPIDRSFSMFLQEIQDEELKKFLKTNCDNYGELHDVLVPAMKEADRTAKELNEDFVRTILGIPKI